MCLLHNVVDSDTLRIKKNDPRNWSEKFSAARRRRRCADRSTVGTVGTPAFSVYSATKAAVRNFARNWILDLKDRHIRVNMVSPGVIDTAGLNELFGGGTQSEAVKSSMLAGIPYGRVGHGEDVANAVHAAPVTWTS
jgi:NAD(P)-dependent dehydrogenase (short-subunit alcohol dehydrogenase family)